MSELRNTSLYTLATGGEYYAHGPLSPLMHETDEGEQLVGGYIVLNTLPAGLPNPEDVERMVIDAAPGVPPLDGMLVYADGSEPWDPAVLALAYPSVAPYLLRGAWMGTGDDGEPIVVHGWMSDMPDGAEIVEAGVVPHGWSS